MNFQPELAWMVALAEETDDRGDPTSDFIGWATVVAGVPLTTTKEGNDGLDD